MRREPLKSKKKKEDGRRPGNGVAATSIVVIGGSAGGFITLVRILDHWKPAPNMAVFVVLHLAPTAHIAFLLQHIQARTKLKCTTPADGEDIKPGTLYLGAPDVHLLFTSGNRIVLGKGPDENRFRPSIDVLFRSAAVHFGGNVTAVILTGLLEDGVAGMAAVRECGGTCIVQDPTDAEFPDLPIAVINHLKPDSIKPADVIGDSINRASQRRNGRKTKIPAKLKQEALIAEKTLTAIDATRTLGDQSLFTCPDCGGVLWHVADHGPSRYRCFTGHAYTEKTLLEKQNQSLQMTLWVALRMFEERKELLSQLPSTVTGRRRIKDLEGHIKTLKALLSDIQKLTQPTTAAHGKKDFPEKEESKTR